MSRLTAALCFVAITSPACTVIYQVAPDETSEGDASSWPAPNPADDSSGGEPEGTSSNGEAPDSSTGEPAGSSSTGAAESTSTTGSTGDEPLEGSTSTGEEIEGTSTSGDSSTGDAPIEEGSTSTGDEPPPPPPLIATGKQCEADEECASGTCAGSPVEDERRCTDACDPTIATSCQALGHPGLCLTSGPNTYACVGWGLPANSKLELLPPLPPGWDFTNATVVLGEPDQRGAVLLPASDVGTKLEMSALLGGQGYGAVIFDLVSHSGTVLSTHEHVSSNGVYAYDKVPLSPNHHHWLLIRHAPNATKSYSQIYRKPSV